jgi:hypothetical protein
MVNPSFSPHPSLIAKVFSRWIASAVGIFRTFATDLAMAIYGVKADLTDAVPRRFMVSPRLAPA